ncbi:imidazoleglycerol-phosphate dehydratase HisB [Nitratifractor salsuginis]|uniref:Imidazoleglycerol-phosphate dehydratase n=1 Tax=Nitratifractor salsuginis (strain DSM 16511 / JCM 12458 / E9I37-1) TaxID=749222 RepID=E6X355_NITSE|nr:imidazoleglycerol-phosphate dehydratase HisB [Nitratifractor salsuginis]ADV46199.1 imidazoleglycerol-phosphate dehydratase [Nitratifractor salsuginis DSM 16511]
MYEKRRVTKETDITIKLNLYGTGEAAIDTGVGFFDHMLESFARHALLDLEVTCQGDLHIDAHHSVEDVGIVLGQLLGEAIYPVKGMERFGNAVVVMDEAAVECDIDLSGRAYLVFELPVEGKVGEFDTELVEEFFRALVFNLPITCHLTARRGRNRHHLIEAAFKALAVALRRAVTPNERIGVPSTKGVL